MEKPLFGNVTYPQGVEYVTLAVNNARVIIDELGDDKANQHFEVLSRIVKRYAGAKMLPMRVCTEVNKMVFDFDGFMIDRFGNVRAYYQAKRNICPSKGDGSITLEDTTKMYKATLRVGKFNVGDVVKTKGGVLYIHQADGLNVSSDAYIAVEDGDVELATQQERELFFGNLLNNGCRFDIQTGFVLKIGKKGNGTTK